MFYSRTVIDTTQSSQSPFSTPNSSQDSLHKNQQQQQQQKKKGIKSSLGRLFSKKEKQKAKALAQDLLLPSGGYLPCMIFSQDPVKSAVYPQIYLQHGLQTDLHIHLNCHQVSHFTKSARQEVRKRRNINKIKNQKIYREIIFILKLSVRKFFILSQKCETLASHRWNAFQCPLFSKLPYSWQT